MIDRIAPVSKATVTRLFIAANLALGVGLVIGLVTLVSALADGAVTIGGSQVVSFDGDAIGGALPWLAIAAVALAGGVIAAVVSWIGALISTARLDDKTWFVGLLVVGLISLGWVAMVAYAVAGPDGAVPLSADQGVAPATRI
jgi:hypothetical protein